MVKQFAWLNSGRVRCPSLSRSHQHQHAQCLVLDCAASPLPLPSCVKLAGLLLHQMLSVDILYMQARGLQNPFPYNCTKACTDIPPNEDFTCPQQVSSMAMVVS